MMMASRMIGLVWIEREPPAASITASSESEFMPLSVCVAPIYSANGMTRLSIGGTRVAASAKKVISAWPEAVSRLT